MTRGRRTVAVLAFFVVVSVVHTWPLATSLSRRMFDHGDAVLNTWALNDMARQLVHNPLRPFDGNIFHPYSRSLASVDHVIANAILAVPIRAFNDGAVFVHNVIFLITYVLSGFFTYLLVRALTGSTAGGLVAGCAFAFSVFRMTHSIHLHLLGTQWLPLALLALHRYLGEPSLRRLLVLTASGLLVALSSWHMALLGGPMLALASGLILAADRRPPWRRIVALAAAAAVVALCLLPIGLVYRDVATEWRRQPTEGAEKVRERARNSATIEGVLPPWPDAGLVTDRTYSEYHVFPGATVTILALPALALLRRRRPSRAGWLLRFLCGAAAILVGLMLAAVAGGEGWLWLVDRLRWLAPFAILGLALLLAVGWRTAAAAPEDAPVGVYAALALAGLFLSLGPRVFGWEVDLGAGLYFYDYLPAIGIIRAPGRFSLLLALGAAVLAGMGVSREG